MLLLVWLAPIAIGLLCAGYEFALFRLADTDPANPPAYQAAPLIFACLFGAGWTALVFARSVRRAGVKIHYKRINLLIAVIAGLLCVFYVLIRSMMVENALIAQLGYACCVESLPVWAETIAAILNPVLPIFRIW
jgi:peptidoglycan/LPS O-acetylase OafA/YrhL